MAFLSKIGLTKKKQQLIAPPGESEGTRNHDIKRGADLNAPASSRHSTSTHGERNDRLSVQSPSRYPNSSRPSLSTTATSRHGKPYEGPCMDAPLEWLKTCRKKHRYCSETLHVGYRPTRLVDLGADFDFSRARLVEKSAHHGAVDYLVLSYCWGTTMTDAGITTIATFGEKKTRLKRSKLPRTFKHFFEIAKLMKIRYVWIDSLCIVQDSDKDRQRELACVGQIYSGAVCTIAAESAKDAQGGIWLESRIRKVEVEGTTTLETISQEQNIRTYLSVIDQRLHKSPLQQRAWSLPERMLSPRVLHFTFSHIYWECREIKLDNPVLLADVEEVVASPAGRQAASSEWHHMTKLRPFDVPVDIRMDPYSTGFLSSLSTSNLFYVWRMLIEDYTTKYLTQWSDRLPALSGLAAETQMHVNSEYICGIWSDDPKGLLWAVDDSVHTSEKVEIGAPSWSWASHERDPITYRHIHEALATEDVETIPLARIMHTHIVPAGLDPKGRASYGSVHIMCRARRITCVEHLHSMRCTFYREDATIRPQFKYSEHNSVMIIRVLASERNGSWGLVLQPSTKYGQVDFVRIGVIGGVENRWFDDGYDRTVSIV